MNTESVRTIRLPASEIHKCRRCGGSGTVAHKHVLGGVCFGCSGSGWRRNVRRAAPDARVFAMTIWTSGMVTACVTTHGAGISEESNGELTYAAPASVLADRGVTEADFATIDDDTFLATRARDAFRAAAEKYGWR